MPKFYVQGRITASVGVEVEAANEDEAIEIADREFGGVIGYAGNGGNNKLIGVSGTNESLTCDNDVEWEDAEEN